MSLSVRSIFKRRLNWIGFVCSVLMIGGILGPISFPPLIVYAVYSVGSVIAILLNARVVNKAPACLLAVCALSIVFGQPDPLFHSWERLGLFVLLIFSFFPLFESRKLTYLRSVILKFSLLLCAIIAIGSLVCFFLGINYMTKYSKALDIEHFGFFGGLTKHSMMLGPISAISFLSFAWISIAVKCQNKYKIIAAIGAFLSLCVVMLSASRGALLAGLLGCLLMTWARYRHYMHKFYKKIFLLIVAGILAYPVYEPYLQKVMDKQENNIKAGNTTFYSRSSRWEHRWEEITENAVLGCGFAAMYTKNRRGEYDAKTGVIEPGSSWMGIASQIGLVGFLIVLYMYVSTFFNLLKSNNEWSYLLIAIWGFFLVHLVIEGYIFAAGSYLCFFFWLTFGCSYALKTGYKCR